jgi:hypothetical protein
MNWRFFCSFVVLGCAGEPLTVEVEGSCGAFTLDYEETSDFNVTGVRDAWGVVDAATAEDEIGLLFGVRTARAAFARIGLDGTSIGEPLELDLGGCEPAGLAHDGEGFVALASCADQVPDVERGYRIEADGAREIFGFDLPDVRWLSYDAANGEYLLASSGEFVHAAAGDQPAFDPLDPQPFPELGWGPSSGFEAMNGTLALTRDAFEGRMENKIALQRASGGELCVFNVEGAPGLTGAPGVIAAGDDTRLWALTSDGSFGQLVEFHWTPR